MNGTTIRDADLRNVEPALRRAAERARRTAAATRTPLVVYRNGKVTRQTVREESVAYAFESTPSRATTRKK